uniref:Glycosyl transferase, family 25 n=1 Tax=Candidatus Kentrum sp. TC TaxID=2126339 RepID=A0A450YM50_9GAMM|nr:MAG: glycosyl transferase, family 25 [Candidatus Kentron sp. TC]
MPIDDVHFSIYVINLEDERQRLNTIRDFLRKVRLTPFNVIEAVNGHSLDPHTLVTLYDERSAIDRVGRRHTLGEIGCALSHRKAYGNLVSSEAPWSLILEDDAWLSEETRQVLENADRWLSGAHPRILLLTPLKTFLGKSARPLDNGHDMVDVLQAQSTVGYAINRAAASALISTNAPIRLMADDWVAYRRFSKLDIKGVDPWLICQSDTSSGLEGERSLSRIRKQRTFRYRLNKLRDNIGIKLISWLWWKPFYDLRKH